MRFSIAPQKVGVGLAANLKHIKNERPFAVGLTELDKGPTSAVPIVRNVFSHDEGWNVCAKDQGQHSQEVAQVFRGTLISNRLTMISHDVAGPGTGNDRWLNESEFRRGVHKYVWLHTHVNAVIQNHDPKSPNYLEMLHNDRVDPTARAMQMIEAHAKAAFADPTIFGVFVSGDFNILPTPKALRWQYSPQEMFHRLGMEWRNSRVVYFAWSKNMKFKSAHEVPDHTKTNLSDHGRLIVNVSPKLLARAGR